MIPTPGDAEIGSIGRRAKAVDNVGLRYGATESALRPPLPTATPSPFRAPTSSPTQEAESDPS